MEQLERIRKKLVIAKQDRDILTGKLEALTDELKDMGYDVTEEAEQAITEITKEIDKCTKDFEELLTKFEKKYPELVDSNV